MFGHSEICRPGVDEEISRKNIIFLEFLSQLRQISGGQRLFAYFLVGQKVGCRSHFSQRRSVYKIY